MNQRINKLAQLAGLAWAEDVGCGFPDIKYPPGYEKFAELIVKECMNQCEDMDDQYRIGIYFEV